MLTRSALHLQEALLSEMGRLRYQSADYDQCERLKQSLQSFRNQVSGDVPTGMISTGDLHLPMPDDKQL